MTALSAAIVLYPTPLAGTASDPAEAAWVARAQGGDSAAFRWLFDRHAPSVHRFVRDLLRDVPAADEATQETFVRAFDKLGSIHEGQRFRAWVLGIARNVVRESRRRRRILEALGDFAARLKASEDLDAAIAGVEDSSTPETLLLDRERAVLLERALDRLGENRRTVLLLRFDHGLSGAEAAELLGWSIAKVKVEVHRAKAQLRAFIAEAHPDEEDPR